MLYYLYELNHAALSPARLMAEAGRLYFSNPLNPISQTALGRASSAMCDIFERATRRYGKPQFGIESVRCGDQTIAIREHIIWRKPFCNLVHFRKREARRDGNDEPKILIVAPMSGHYATLLRGTVEALLPDHDVYVSDWVDARKVPMTDGKFDLDSFIDYVIEMVELMGPDVHVVAVCQPSVPVLAAVARLEATKSDHIPRSMILIGGPIDTRINPTIVSRVAEDRGIEWFEKNVIATVPFPHPGFMRKVYPGFLQLSGFMAMNFDRHIRAQYDYFEHLVEGDGDSAEKHMEFYDEYMAVMDLTAEFYLQTVDTVFVRHALPKGEMTHRGARVDPALITRVGLMTIEGERDDISGVGQTEAAHKLCTKLAKRRRQHHLQPGVGHYGVFNGSRFKRDIVPRIAKFVRSQNKLAR